MDESDSNSHIEPSEERRMPMLAGSAASRLVESILARLGGPHAAPAGLPINRVALWRQVARRLGVAEEPDRPVGYGVAGLTGGAAGRPARASVRSARGLNMVYRYLRGVRSELEEAGERLPEVYRARASRQPSYRFTHSEPVPVPQTGAQLVPLPAPEIRALEEPPASAPTSLPTYIDTPTEATSDMEASQLAPSPSDDLSGRVVATPPASVGALAQVMPESPRFVPATVVRVEYAARPAVTPPIPLTTPAPFTVASRATAFERQLEASRQAAMPYAPSSSEAPAPLPFVAPAGAEGVEPAPTDAVPSARLSGQAAVEMPLRRLAPPASSPQPGDRRGQTAPSERGIVGRFFERVVSALPETVRSVIAPSPAVPGSQPQAPVASAPAQTPVSAPSAPATQPVPVQMAISEHAEAVPASQVALEQGGGTVEVSPSNQAIKAEALPSATQASPSAPALPSGVDVSPFVVAELDQAPAGISEGSGALAASRPADQPATQAVAGAPQVVETSSVRESSDRPRGSFLDALSRVFNRGNSAAERQPGQGALEMPQARRGGSQLPARAGSTGVDQAAQQGDGRSETRQTSPANVVSPSTGTLPPDQAPSIVDVQPQAGAVADIAVEREQQIVEPLASASSPNEVPVAGPIVVPAQLQPVEVDRAGYSSVIRESVSGRPVQTAANASLESLTLPAVRDVVAGQGELADPERVPSVQADASTPEFVQGVQAETVMPEPVEALIPDERGSVELQRGSAGGPIARLLARMGLGRMAETAAPEPGGAQEGEERGQVSSVPLMPLRRGTSVPTAQTVATPQQRISVEQSAQAAAGSAVTVGQSVNAAERADTGNARLTSTPGVAQPVAPVAAIMVAQPSESPVAAPQLSRVVAAMPRAMPLGPQPVLRAPALGRPVLEGHTPSRRVHSLSEMSPLLAKRVSRETTVPEAEPEEVGEYYHLLQESLQELSQLYGDYQMLPEQGQSKGFGLPLTSPYGALVMDAEQPGSAAQFTLSTGVAADLDWDAVGDGYESETERIVTYEVDSDSIARSEAFMPGGSYSSYRPSTSISAPTDTQAPNPPPRPTRFTRPSGPRYMSSAVTEVSNRASAGRSGEANSGDVGAWADVVATAVSDAPASTSSFSAPTSNVSAPSGGPALALAGEERASTFIQRVEAVEAPVEDKGSEGAEGPSVDEIADSVYTIIRRRLEIEKERHFT